MLVWGCPSRYNRAPWNTELDLAHGGLPMALREIDPEIADLMAQELHRQESTLELIASENHVSKAVMEAAGSVLTNKYAEGYTGKRYYGGCPYYDEIEPL